MARVMQPKKREAAKNKLHGSRHGRDKVLGALDGTDREGEGVVLQYLVLLAREGGRR